jgi:predicted P-loop ATPase
VNLDDFDRVSDKALLSIEGLLFEWFPNGVKDGHEFCIGSLSGEAGKSLRVRLTGAKAGFWSDFSMDGEAGRDLISLYAAKERISQGKACADIADQLGIALSDSRPLAANSDSSRAKPTRAQKSAPAQAGQGVEMPTEPKRKTEWVPILPVPEDAIEHPAAHIKRGRPEMTWQYRDQLRRLLGVIYRFKTSDGGKEVLPCVYAEHSKTGKREWRWMQFPEPRPLYLPGALRPDFPVLVVEGEKCADVAHQLLLDAWDVVSWPGGGKAPKKVDWSPLAGRRVILWPDADAKRYKEGHPFAGELKSRVEQPGEMTMATIAEVLVELGCDVHIVDVPGPDEEHGGLQVDEDGHDGWDIADLVAAGGTREIVDEWLQRLRVNAQDDVPAEHEPEHLNSDEVPAHVLEPIDDGEIPDNVVPLRPGAKSISTPRKAGAGGLTRRQIRDKMIAGATPGSVRGCRENVYVAMKFDPLLKDLVALDQFAMTQVKRKDPPWPSEPGEWTEGDDFHLGIYLAEHYGLVIAAVGDIEKAVAQSARENGFNPVLDMFEECAANWDRQERVATAFSTYWSAPDSEYMQLVSTMFFVGMAKRAYFPGVKHDYAPVFEGGQGEGKSTSLSILGGQWFADTPFKMGDKDGFLAIQGVLLYEIAELEQFNRSEVTAVKAFMSSQVDRYREPYGRRMRNQQRRTVFAATTNEGQYFKDPTGNRRFWPVSSGRIDLEGLRRDRDQLLGEAVHLMRAGVKWFPTRDQQVKLITPQQSERDIWDEWTGRIWEYVEGYDTEGKQNLLNVRDKVTARELLVKALHVEIGKIGNAKAETMRISNVMRKLGWIKSRETTGPREWIYERPAAEAASEVVEMQGGDDDLPL